MTIFPCYLEALPTANPRTFGVALIPNPHGDYLFVKEITIKVKPTNSSYGEYTKHISALTFLCNLKNNNVKIIEPAVLLRSDQTIMGWHPIAEQLTQDVQNRILDAITELIHDPK